MDKIGFLLFFAATYRHYLHVARSRTGGTHRELPIGEDRNISGGVGVLVGYLVRKKYNYSFIKKKLYCFFEIRSRRRQVRSRVELYLCERKVTPSPSIFS